MLLLSRTIIDTIRIVTEKLMGTSPNIYEATFAWTDKYKVIVINDEVEAKDYEDISRMIMNRKVFKADKVIFFAKSQGNADIVINEQENITEDDIAVNVMVYAKKVLKLHSGNVDIKVLHGDSKELICINVDIDKGIVHMDKYNNSAKNVRVHMGKKRRIVL